MYSSPCHQNQCTCYNGLSVCKSKTKGCGRFVIYILLPLSLLVVYPSLRTTLYAPVNLLPWMPPSIILCTLDFAHSRLLQSNQDVYHNHGKGIPAGPHMPHIDPFDMAKHALASWSIAGLNSLFDGLKVGRLEVWTEHGSKSHWEEMVGVQEQGRTVLGEARLEQ